MSDGLLLAGSILGGAVAAAITVWGANRKLPSRVTTDSVTLVDASGKVISNLTAEIHRLEAVAEAARAEAADSRGRAEALEAEIERLEAEIRRLEREVEDLKTAHRNGG
jgi:predicted  nucleic acid-binding Zn-ribbon protein